MVATSALADRIARVQAAVARAAERAGRDPAAVTLVAVSKTVDRDAVDAAYALGLRHFGENRVQEAAAKFSAPLPADGTLHLVGQLQSNKARPAVDLFDLVESVDRPSLVEALERAAARAGRLVPVLLQVNVAREPQKAGCPPEQAAGLLDLLRRCPHLSPRGLMTIAPLSADAEATRPVFRGLRDLRDTLRRDVPQSELGVLSMGMTNDFAIAIEEGATHVRIGRAIFGE